MQREGKGRDSWLGASYNPNCRFFTWSENKAVMTYGYVVFLAGGYGEKSVCQEEPNGNW